MANKNFLKCSLVIKRIPSWIKNDSRVKVQQIDERKVHEASMLGLSVFRDSIYEREKRPVIKKRQLKRRIRENSRKYFLERSDTDYDPDYVTDESNYGSDSEANFMHDLNSKKTKVHKNFTKSKHESFLKRANEDSSSSSEGYESLKPTSKKLKSTFNNREKINNRKDSTGKMLCLIPVAQKYETKEEMMKRHNLMLKEAKRQYEKVVKKVKEEEQIMNLQLSSFEKYKKRKRDSDEILPSPNLERKPHYLCPLHFCSAFFSSPKEHLLVHKDHVTTDEEKDTYLKALKIVGENCNKLIMNKSLKN